MVVATVILLFACAAVCNCVGPEPPGGFEAYSANPEENCKVPWHYDIENDTFGPYCWGNTWKNCYGTKQSPINIDTEKVSYKSFSPKYNLSKELSGTLVIVERSPKFLVNERNSLYNLSQIPFLKKDEMFRLKQFHMHFPAKEDGVGSEHRINCEGYDGELHFVHKKPNEAESETVVVLAIFVEKGDNTELALQGFFENLKEVQKCGDAKNFSLHRLTFLENLEDLYTYNGSFTTPPCDERVIWLIKRKPITVSEEHFEILEQLRYDEIHISEHGNIRPPFPMTVDRKVHANFKVPNGENKENKHGNNNDKNNGDECTEWYKSRRCRKDNDDS
uniref:Carbonic anhydrase n=1 Tax=Sinohyriopsis cumingii TaxID=165450 RepID=A0A0P0M6J7_SINCU|nr:carbonic anhydrase 2 [Sinohyriopsis cumingii]